MRMLVSGQVRRKFVLRVAATVSLRHTDEVPEDAQRPATRTQGATMRRRAFTGCPVFGSDRQLYGCETRKADVASGAA